MADGGAAAVLLAAGLSRRYGAVGKLVADYRGRPLALHIADTLAMPGFAQRIAVCRSGDDDLAALLHGRGFTVVRNPDAARGMGSSLALGIGAVRVERAMVCLADMPHVTAAHIRNCLAASAPAGIVATSGPDGVATPPAVFARRHFPALMAFKGDQGARSLLRGATLVPAAAEELADFDTPADFR